MDMALNISQILGVAAFLGASYYLLFVYAVLRDRERETAGEIVPRSMAHRMPTLPWGRR